MKLIITLSGKSERFTESGYPKKQLVRVLGKPVLEHVVEMYTSICSLRDMHFILKDGDIETHKLLMDTYGRVNICHVEPHSRGPCYSVLQCDFDWMEDEEIIVKKKFRIPTTYSMNMLPAAYTTSSVMQI